MRLILVSIIAIVLASSVLAEVVVEVHLRVSKNDSVVVEQFRTVLGKPDLSAVFASDYRVIVKEGNLTKFSTFVPVEFAQVEPWSQEVIIPKQEFDSTGVSFKLPYFGNIGEVVLLREDSRLLTLQLSDLCNGNVVCDYSENFLSCEEDCPLKSADGYCYPASDKVCDPDCAKAVDADCFVPSSRKKFFAVVLVVLLVLALLGGVWYLIERAKHL